MFIHNSALQFHGKLSTSAVIIDRRFRAKLCGHTTKKFSTLLNAGKLYPEDDITMNEFLGPEMLTDKFHPGSKEGDVYSVGIVIAQTLTTTGVLLRSVVHTTSVTGRCDCFG